MVNLEQTPFFNTVLKLHELFLGGVFQNSSVLKKNIQMFSRNAFLLPKQQAISHPINCCLSVIQVTTVSIIIIIFPMGPPQKIIQFNMPRYGVFFY